MFCAIAGFAACGDESTINTVAESSSIVSARPTAVTIPVTLPTVDAPSTRPPVATSTDDTAWFLTLRPDVPADQCNIDAIRRDTAIPVEFRADCVGPWTYGREECPVDECEGTRAFRWVHDRWVDRGMHYAFCPLAMISSGLPYDVALMLGTEMFCGPPDRRMSAEPPTGTLSFGDEGPRVRALQERLIAANILFDIADGQFGPNTQAAVCDLQHLAELDVTCEADRAVLGILGLAE
jgi:hypothetical protein